MKTLETFRRRIFISVFSLTFCLHTYVEKVMNFIWFLHLIYMQLNRFITVRFQCVPFSPNIQLQKTVLVCLLPCVSDRFGLTYSVNVLLFGEWKHVWQHPFTIALEYVPTYYPLWLALTPPYRTLSCSSQ